MSLEADSHDILIKTPEEVARKATKVLIAKFITTLSKNLENSEQEKATGPEADE